MTKYNVLTETFNPSLGMVETFLCSIYAADRAEALRLGRKEIERGEKLIVRVAK